MDEPSVHGDMQAYAARRALNDPRQAELAPLVRSMASGTQNALAELYDRTSPVLFALALRILSNPQDAEEVVYDVYSKAWRRAGSYTEARGSVMSWLVLMTRSLAIDRLRAARRHTPVSAPLSVSAEEEVSTLVVESSPEDKASAAERTRRLQAALSGLPREQRELLELAFFSGLSHAEIADHTALPLGTVKTRIRAGLIRLRTSLQDLEGG